MTGIFEQLILGPICHVCVYLGRHQPLPKSLNLRLLCLNSRQLGSFSHRLAMRSHLPTHPLRLTSASLFSFFVLVVLQVVRNILSVHGVVVFIFVYRKHCKVTSATISDNSHLKIQIALVPQWGKIGNMVSGMIMRGRSRRIGKGGSRRV